MMDISDLSELDQGIVADFVSGLRSGLAPELALQEAMLSLCESDPEVFVGYLLSIRLGRKVGGFSRDAWLDPWRSSMHPEGWRRKYAKVLASDFGKVVFRWMHARNWPTSPKLNRQLRVHGYLHRIIGVNT